MSLFTVTSKLLRNRQAKHRRQELRRAVRTLTQIESLEDRRLLATMTFGNVPGSYNDYSELGLGVDSAAHVLLASSGGDVALRVAKGTSGTPPWVFDAGGAAFTMSRLNVESFSGAGSIEFTAIPSGSSVSVSSAGVVQFPAGFSSVTSVQITMAANVFPVVLIDDVEFSLAPNADAGGSYTVLEGDSVTVSGILSSDPDQSGSSLAYAWDFDSDGLFDDATGISPAFSAIALDGPTSRMIGLKVTDSSGLSTTDTAVVAIGNKIPTIDQLSAPTEIPEGSIALFSAIASDVAADDLQYTWNFGDGHTTVGTPIPSHVFVDNGTYTVTLHVSDDDGGIAVQTRQVAVNNLAPVISGVSVTPAVDEGGTVSLSFTAIDSGVLDTFTILVDWGDGTINNYSAPGAGSFSFGAIHNYLDNVPGQPNGNYPIAIQVIDNDGAVGAVGAAATVNNLAPQISALSITPAIDENGTVNLSFNGGDVGTLDTHTIHVDWGDGATNTFPINTPGGFSFGTIHTYLDDNASDSYDVTLTLTDDDGGVAVETRQVTVHNVAPVLDNFTFDASIDTSGVATISGSINGAILDPGSLDTHMLIFDYGDGTSSQIPIVAGQASFSVHGDCAISG
ncbi:MAG: PKD domain-containing protein, partial [Planctomycetales bacterium]|nr:PKD domain-containing protein [Planctomycetales bacterium]